MNYIIYSLLALAAGSGILLLIYTGCAILLHWNYEANVAPFLVEEDHEDVRLYQRAPKR